MNPLHLRMICRSLNGLLLLALIAPQMLCADDITRDEIFRVWEERQKSVKTMHFEWTTQRTILRGTQIGKFLEDNTGQVFPEKDTTVELKMTLYLAPNRWYYSQEGLDWWGEAEQFVYQRRIRVFDGVVYKRYEGLEDIDVDIVHSVGRIKSPAKTKLMFGYNLYLRPILDHFRAMHADLGPFPNRAEWRTSSKSGTVGDRECVILEKVPKGQNPMFMRYWIDPKKNFSILRLTRGFGRTVDLQVDIQYGRDLASGIWYPMRWSAAERLIPGRAETGDSSTGVVTKVQLNPKIAEEQFQFEFPDGTEVIDYRGEQKVSYAVRDGGEKRIITDEERRRSPDFSEILETDTGQAGLPQEKRSWLWFTIPALVLVIVGLVVWKLRFQRV